MATAPVDTPTITSTNLSASGSNSSVEPPGSFDIGSFELVREFVERVVAPGAAASLEGSHVRPNVIDWDVVKASVAHSCSFEQAIGRAVVIADQMSRGVFDNDPLGLFYSLPDDGEPFFAFSVGNAIPDFGDESRYRSRVARRMGGILKRTRGVAIT
jgi:hypothetical protein